MSRALYPGFLGMTIAKIGKVESQAAMSRLNLMDL